MNRHVLKRPTLILLYGYPGTGKTFFARQFAPEINAALISADHLRFEFFESPTYSKEENEIVDHLMYFMAEQFLQAGLTVIYDANVSRLKDRRLLKELAQKQKADTFLIWFQLDIESSFTRVVKRDRRKADDKYAIQLDRTSFDDVISKMQNPAHNEEYVVVSGKHTIVSQKNSVIKKFHEMKLVETDNSAMKLAKPELVNRIPNPLAGIR
jgi:predicted kinase